MMELKTKGFEVLKKEDKSLIFSEIEKISSQFHIDLSKLAFVISEDALEYHQAGACGLSNYNKEERSYDFGIVYLNLRYYEFFGIDHIVKTLRHEFAHIITYQLGQDKVPGGHDDTFKEICMFLKGHMNPAIAVGKYESCKDDQFLVDPETKYIYTCPTCKLSEYRKEMLPFHVIASGRCAKCDTSALKFKVENYKKVA
jgi:predicted SprT family Zn-dependent metalloprotease